MRGLALINAILRGNFWQKTVLQREQLKSFLGIGQWDAP